MVVDAKDLVENTGDSNIIRVGCFFLSYWIVGDIRRCYIIDG